jgi:hypothetical protein
LSRIRIRRTRASRNVCCTIPIGNLDRSHDCPGA